MTAKELIDQLSKYDSDMEVIVLANGGGGYVYLMEVYETEMYNKKCILIEGI